MHMAENGFCEHGEQERIIQQGETEIGGRFSSTLMEGVTNGEPVGASGLRQVYENVSTSRKRWETTRPNDPKVAYTHVYGAL